MRRSRRGTSALLSMVVASSLLAFEGPSALAASPTPRLRLIRTTDTVIERVRHHRPFRFNPGVYLAALDAPLEIRVSRPDYDTAMTAEQVLGDASTVPLPDAVLDDYLYTGLARFVRMTVTDAGGDVRIDRLSSLCPNGYDVQRVGDEGPIEPTYPDGCGWNPFTLGMVWGIDRDWAVNMTSAAWDLGRMRLPAGRYHVDLAIAPMYRDLFDVAPADAFTSLTLIVQERRRDRTPRAPVPSSSPTVGRQPRVPTDTTPDPSTVPDLIPLPSWSMWEDERDGRDMLSFAANVWVRGPAPLVVEGFRKEGEAVMDGYQYFYDGDQQVGRAHVGTFEYDARKDHRHWHFRQFATYELLAQDRSTVVVSTKEAFCLAPTDPIDLTVPKADYRPWPLGLSTACGNADALWVREVLPVGWGDTYYQYLPGQAFDITDVPNGTYFVKVQANPGGHLYETNMGNNIRLRKVIIRGRPGHRRIEVPPWHGIDTEGGFFRALTRREGRG